MGAEGQGGAAVASSGERVPSPCSQAGNNPFSWDWGPRQIPKLLASWRVFPHIWGRTPPLGPGEPCVRLQLLAAASALSFGVEPG